MKPNPFLFARTYSPFLKASREGPAEDGTFDYFPYTDTGVSPPPPPNPPIAFVQSSVQYEPFNETTDPQEFDFETPPVQGNDLLVWVAVQDIQDQVTPATITVTNAGGDPYVQLGSYAQMTKVNTITRISLWYKRADDGVDDNSYIVTPNQEVSMATMPTEYEGFADSGLLDDADLVSNGDALTMQVGPLDVTGLGELSVGCFISSFVVDTVTPGAGFTLLESIDGSAGDLDIVMYLVHQLDIDGPTTSTPEATWDGGADDFAAVGVTIKD